MRIGAMLESCGALRPETFWAWDGRRSLWGAGSAGFWGVWVAVFHGRPDGLLASDLPGLLHSPQLLARQRATLPAGFAAFAPADRTCFVGFMDEGS